MYHAGEWRIGQLRLHNRVLLAPLAGVSASPFRRICREFGCALVHTEMVNARGWGAGQEHTLDYLRFHESERPLCVQIFGHEPDIMGKAAALAAEIADAIDINMGCPAPGVTRTGAGGALLRNPALAGKIMEAVVDNSGGRPVTVKMRAGWGGSGSAAFKDDTGGSYKDNRDAAYLEIAGLAEDCGVSAVTLHPRTVEQRFSGNADREKIRRLVGQVDIPVIGSGDIFTPGDARDMLEQTGCKAVMMGRGAFGNPWLIRNSIALLEGRPMEPERPGSWEIKTVALRHARLNTEFFGEVNGIKDLRKHLLWYLKGRIPRKKKTDISRIRTLEEVARFMDENMVKDDQRPRFQ